LFFINIFFQVLLRIKSVEALVFRKKLVVVTLRKLVVPDSLVFCFILQIFIVGPAPKHIVVVVVIRCEVIFILIMTSGRVTTEGYQRFTITELREIACCHTSKVLLLHS
jgi:hypothetical protein